MSRAMGLKAAAFQKARKAQMVIDRAAEAERRRKQWEWDHFEPDVWGQPPPGTSPEEYEAIINRARKNHQNVMFGGGDWFTGAKQDPPSLSDKQTEPPVIAVSQAMGYARQPPHGFWYTVGQMLGINPLDKYPSQP
jgi:hypothetical protein